MLFCRENTRDVTENVVVGSQLLFSPGDRTSFDEIERENSSLSMTYTATFYVISRQWNIYNIYHELYYKY